MRHVRIVALCVTALFALAALTAGSAMAAGPEFGQCFEKAKGKYANAGCTTKAKKGTGTFEWRKEKNVTESKTFKGEGGAGILTGEYNICTPGEERRPHCAEGEEEKVLLEKPLTIECTAENNFGEFTGDNTVGHISVRFKGCKLLGAVPCQNTSNEGEVVVNPLKGSLGFINKSKEEVGILLTPEQKKGAFATFSCSLGETPLTTVVGEGNSKEGAAYSPESKGGNDGIISPIGPVNTMTNSLTQVYTVNENEENVPNKFETGPIESLESYVFNATEPQRTTKWSKAGEAITNTNTSETTGEIKA